MFKVIRLVFCPALILFPAAAAAIGGPATRTLPAPGPGAGVRHAPGRIGSVTSILSAKAM
jgi:hypothetical protein